MSSMNPAWQPSGARDWPDQVNEQLSRQGMGMEEHERRIADLARRVNDLEMAVDLLISLRNQESSQERRL